MTQTIGIIGSGLVGKAVARLATAAGYKVVISNSRGADTIKDLIEELGPLASAGTFAGKVVLDQTNYYPAFGNNDVLDKAELTSSELIQRRLPGAKVVKGFHNLSWLHMKANATPNGSANRTTLPIAGD
ncbi:MAG: oxidoreductase, partial [Mesorhizobium sp.]